LFLFKEEIMDIGQASTFLVGSLLVSIAVIVLCAMLIFLNNLFARFWKPVKMFKFVDYPLATYQQPPVEEKKTQ
jgi:hypothetical protein